MSQVTRPAKAKLIWNIAWGAEKLENERSVRLPFTTTPEPPDFLQDTIYERSMKTASALKL